jgi:hypothetical protein
MTGRVRRISNHPFGSQLNDVGMGQTFQFLGWGLVVLENR